MDASDTTNAPASIQDIMIMYVYAVYSNKREVFGLITTYVFHDTGVITKNSVNGMHDHTTYTAFIIQNQAQCLPPPPYSHSPCSTSSMNLLTTSGSLYPEN